MKTATRLAFTLFLGVISSVQAVTSPDTAFKKNPNYDVIKIIGCWSASPSAEGAYPTIRLTGKSKVDLTIFSVEAWFIRDGDKSFGSGYDSSGGSPKGITTTFDVRSDKGYTYGYDAKSKVVAKVMIRHSGEHTLGNPPDGDIYSLVNIPVQNKDCPDLSSN